ncbi:IS66 family insertion sequence element accessory protein TnpA [Sphingobacterium sp.]
MRADWQQSDMSKKQYCDSRGINEAKFYYWFSGSTKER